MLFTIHIFKEASQTKFTQSNSSTLERLYVYCLYIVVY